MSPDDTITEIDLGPPIFDPADELFSHTKAAEPDLGVDGLNRGFASRLADFFRGSKD